MIKAKWFRLPVFALLSLALWPAEASAQATGADGEAGISWLTLEEAVARNAEEPRMIFIDFYTDWCGWCKKMDANTFANPQIAQMMTNDFYAVKFNAESGDVITFKGKTYGLDTTGRRPAHGIAVELATHNERLGYPTFVILDGKLAKQKAFQGFKTVDALKQILEYYGDEQIYTKQNWMQFIQGYQSTVD